MQKCYKIFLLLVLVFGSFTLIKYINPSLIATDSGFDSSYDSGGYDSSSGYSDYDSSSWDSGSNYSDYDSGSWHSSSNYSSKGSSKSLGPAFIIGLIVLIIIVEIAEMTQKSQKRKTQLLAKEKSVYESLKQTKEPLDEEAEKFLSDLDIFKFLEERYNDFVKLQTAWMEYDYDTLRELLTDELYNQYEMQLDTLKLKNEKNVMSNFEYISANITNVFKEKDSLIVRIKMSVAFFDYITKDGNVVRGSNSKKLHMTYELTYTKALQDNQSTCPSCGAPLKNNASVKCEYCKSIISQTSTKWSLKNKKIISQT